MQAALDANIALQDQLQTVKEQIEKFLRDNEDQAASMKQARTNPSKADSTGCCPCWCGHCTNAYIQRAVCNVQQHPFAIGSCVFEGSVGPTRNWHLIDTE